jgi:hypothetical protein
LSTNQLKGGIPTELGELDNLGKCYSTDWQIQ